MSKSITKLSLIFIIFCLLLSGCTSEHNYIISNPDSTPNQIFLTAEPPTPDITSVLTYEINEYYAIDNGTRIYNQADSQSKIISVLSSGDKITLIEEGYDFHFVKYMGLHGYIKCTDFTYITPEITQSVDIETHTFDSPHIVVIKSLHILELWDGDTLITSCTAQIGMNEDGRKEIQGDKKTPEGEYYFSSSNSKSKYYKTLFISYPSKTDAQIALDNSIIAEDSYYRIIDALNSNIQPPYTTPLGGLISIHGKPNEEGYTAGCIAIPNEYMDIIWEHCPLGTTVTILP